MSSIFIVHGSTGEYSDRSEWVVAAFTDLKRAEEWKEGAQKYASELFKSRAGRAGRLRHIGINPYDYYMVIDYTGTEYSIEEVSLDPELPRNI